MKDDITGKPLVGEHGRLAPFNQGVAVGLMLAADSISHEIEQTEIDLASLISTIEQVQNREPYDE